MFVKKRFPSHSIEKHELAKAPAKSPLHSSFSSFAIWRQQRYTPKKSRIFLKDNLVFRSTVCVMLSKSFDKASMSVQLRLPKPESEIGSTQTTDNLLTLWYKDIIEHSK